SYPVLYMHDGQNLFDDATSFSGEWEVDETLNQLHQEGDYGVIVVGIENGGSTRLDEYSPWYNPSYGGGEGDLYIQFITQTLKPHIDSLYRTLPEREFTGIMGSSMGGLISHYAGVAYQEYFSKTGVFSPSFFFSDSVFQVTSQEGKQFGGKFYFMAGAQESGSMVPKMQAMYDTMQNIGFSNDELFYLVENDGQHSEWFWAREFGDAYQWLFGDLVLNIEVKDDLPVHVFPNPFTDSITLTTNEKLNISLIDLNGNLVHQVYVSGNETLHFEHLPAGIYLLKVAHKEKTQIRKLIKIE
ncbi:MAG: T9SS type A sorting domain-containing protein, partial [Bacteroidetes bacterium]|nr:T9SS type A sorting domain-containing protein [Bacteroidota bacterium]